MTIDCIKAYGRITLSILMMLFILTLPILAEEIFLPEQVADPDVTLELSYRDEDTALVGAQFDLYRVADVDSLGSLRFTLTQTFQACFANDKQPNCEQEFLSSPLEKSGSAN